jgi:beta-N-acetylhexosaminidase
MGSNMPGTPEELHAMTAALTIDPSLPPLIATDEEGGDVVRLPWTTSPARTCSKRNRRTPLEPRSPSASSCSRNPA